MNQKERRKGRLMYLFPLMLALTGLALLLLEWALQFSSMEAFSDLKQLMVHNWYIVLFPTVLLLLYLFRVPPMGAYIGAGIAAFLFLVQLIVAVMISKSGQGGSLVNWIPAHTLFASISGALKQWNLNHALRLFSDLCMLLAHGAAILTCLSYAKVKRASDERRSETVLSGNGSAN